jgi:hypothetical protein
MGCLMSFLKTKKTDWAKPFSEKIAKRVSRIPTLELEGWVEQAVYEIGRCMTSYTRSRDPLYLEEALTGAEALHAVIDALYERSPKADK